MAPRLRRWATDGKKGPDDRAKSPIEDAGSAGGTGGTGGTHREQYDWAMASRRPDELPPEMPEASDPDAGASDVPPAVPDGVPTLAAF
jgi:hypothetical protein